MGGGEKKRVKMAKRTGYVRAKRIVTRTQTGLGGKSDDISRARRSIRIDRCKGRQMMEEKKGGRGGRGGGVWVMECLCI